ncbi:MAG: phosphoethanolamine transferase [Burkholderiaceae bacterium]
MKSFLNFSLGSQALRPWQLSLAGSLWLALPANWALWQHLGSLEAVRGMGGLVFGVGFALAIAATTLALLSVLGWGRLLKPTLILLLMAAAFGAHFMLAYGIVIDGSMLTNVLQTDAREAGDLLNLRLLATVLVLGVLPAWWVWRVPLHRQPVRRHLLHHSLLLVGSVLVLLAFVAASFPTLAPLMRNHKEVRYLVNPLNSLYAMGQAVAGERAQRVSPLQPLAEDARQGDRFATHKPPLILFVLGETARSDHFSLNGYARDTNPRLGAMTDIVSWRQVMSCGTSTAASLPCMFSHLGREAFVDSKDRFENLLDVLQRAGLAVLWVDNQSGCKGVCDRVPTVPAAEVARAAGCSGDDCMDEAMLRVLDERIAALDAQRVTRGVVVVLHQMGSHGPAYSKRSAPARKAFVPECTTTHLQNCRSEELINAYDNSLRETDHFLAEAIGWLRTRERSHSTAMLYVSDHGESLGENNTYLHGLPYAIAPKVQKHVPMVAWLSPAMQAAARLPMDCLQRDRDRPLSHDHLFHSVLGLADVRTQAYRPALDFWASCAGASR